MPQRVRENVVRANENPYNFTSDTFKAPVEWTSPTGTRQTYQVHQRTDIDWNMVRTEGPPRFKGKTNAEAAKAGLAPQLPDGSFVRLHHINQDGQGKLVEVSNRYHDFGKTGQDTLHGIWGKQEPHPQNPVNRTRFTQDREAYWRGRRND